MIEYISAVAMIVGFIAAIWFSLHFLFEYGIGLDTVLFSIVQFFLIGIVSLFLGLPSLVFISSGEEVSYREVTSIVKTNNVVHVVDIDRDGVVTEVSKSEASWWNSTNIVLKVRNGKNVYGYSVGEYREIVVGRGE